MGNKFEQIADKKKQAVLAKQENDVQQFAQRVAAEVLAKAKFTHGAEELEEIISGLSTAVAGAIVLTNDKIDENLKDNFSQLLLAVKENKPDNTNLNSEIAQGLVELENKIASLEFSPVINLSALTVEELRAEIAKILVRIPEGSQREVSIAYENAKADKYINVRLTDGISFYKAGGGAVVMGGGGSSDALTDEQLRASPVPVLASIDTTGLATETKQDSIIAAVTATQKVDWGFNDKDAGATYVYYGFESPAGAWKISRKTVATGAFLYSTGASNYAAAWSGRVGQTYASYGTTF